VILKRTGHDWPILIAANRDERHDRQWLPPAAHWPDRPEIVAGMDVLAGGSWLGVNGSGVVAAVLNRQGTLGPEAGKRSRGELVLDALDHVDATDAATALTALDPRAYRPFNLVIADNRDAFLLCHRGGAAKGDAISVTPLAEGLTMVTAMEADDPNSPRIRRYRPRFATAAIPDPAAGDWMGWETLLASREQEPGSGPGGAMFIAGVPSGDPGRFGTVSSSLIALPAIEHVGVAPIWRFAAAAEGPLTWIDIETP
jgi:uncharacterized protein with NRDE domain